MRRMQAMLILGVLLLASSHGAFSLDPKTAIDGYARQAWSTENGLPQNSVHALLQTSDGFLWLGTEGGLARFDGYRFKVFDRTNTPGMSSDDIRCLLEDASKGLWVGTASGLTRLKDGEMQTFNLQDGVPTGAVKAMVRSEDGRVWVLTTGGLAATRDPVDETDKIRFDQPSGLDGTMPIAIAADGKGGVWVAMPAGLGHITHGKLERGPAALAGELIGAIAPGGRDSDTLYVASTRGIFEVKGTKEVVRISAVPVDDARSLLATKNGVWVVARNSVSFLRQTVTKGEDAFYAAPIVFRAGDALPGTQVSSILEDRLGTVWVATNGGLARFAGGRMERTTGLNPGRNLGSGSKPGLGSGPAILAIFEDREGDLWAGSETDGVSVLRDRTFQVLEPLASNSDEAPTSVLQAGDGTVWTGTNGGGVIGMEADGKRGRSYGVKDGLTSDTTFALASGGRGSQDLWVGTSDGVSVLRGGRWKSFTSADGLADDLVRSLLVARDGTVWIGTPHGLTQFRERRMATMTTAQGLGSNLIGPMVDTRDGDLWVGTFSGLSRLRDGTFRNFTVADGLPGNTITALAPNLTGGLWVGTKGQGLARWDGTRFASFAAVPGIPSEIYALLDDGLGSLWMVSEHGIFRAAIAGLEHARDEPKGDAAVVSYGAADGLPSVDTAAIGFPSAWRLNDGRLCVVTRRGVVAVDPARILESEGPPPVVLEEVTVDDRLASSRETASMAPGPLHFSFEFAGINLAAPQRVRYRYILEGFDRDWVDAGTRRAAYYTNIPHGRYRFRVSARNELGPWSEPAELEFELRPHMYQTWWFRGLLMLLTLALALALYGVRVNALRSRFEAVSAERNRLAREIHDTLAQSFVAVSMRLEVMAQMLKRTDGVERCREQLDQTRTLVRESLAEARRSIWNLRAEVAESLPARVSQATQEAAAYIKTAKAETTGSFRPLPAEIEDELYRIAQEALSNTVRHAAAQSVRLHLRYELDSLSLEVADDGRGFDPEHAPSRAEGHFGLTGIRERASLIGAEVMLESVPGGGTTLRVTLPLSRTSKEQSAELQKGSQS